MRTQLAAWRADRPAPIQVPGMPLPAYAHISDAERRQAIAEAPGEAPVRPRKKKK
jgi:hypothetical protein